MYLGIDVGTSAVKAVLIDGEGGFRAAAAAALTVDRPHDGWSEQDPDAWIAASAEAVGALKASHGGELAAVRGIGLSGQMHGATLLDGADRPLRPAILWNDTRAHAEAAELDADPRFRAVTGNIVFPGFTAPKLTWTARHEPEVFAATRRVLLPKDYVRLWLTGEHVSDMSDAAGTAWLDVARRRWSADLLAATGMAEDQMPGLCEGTDPTGHLRGQHAAEWGMAGPVVVAGGAGDNAASACGVGAVRPGSAFVSLGTSGVLFAAADRFSPNAGSAVHTFCHALPGTWHQMGVVLSAAAALDWLAGVLGRDPAELTAGLGDDLAPPSGLAFLPYLAGERTPHNDAAIRGAFVGLDLTAGPDRLTRAVLEGVAFAFADCRDALRAAGTELTGATAVGGGSRSRYWLKLIATALGVPIQVPAAGEAGAALGAARLGLIAATGADPFAVCVPQPTEDTIVPDAGLSARFAEAHRDWRALYVALKGKAT
jgi:xylulokinase